MPVWSCLRKLCFERRVPNTSYKIHQNPKHEDHFQQTAWLLHVTTKMTESAQRHPHQASAKKRRSCFDILRVNDVIVLPKNQWNMMTACNGSFFSCITLLKLTTLNTLRGRCLANDRKNELSWLNLLLENVSLIACWKPFPKKYRDFHFYKIPIMGVLFPKPFPSPKLSWLPSLQNPNHGALFLKPCPSPQPPLCAMILS